MGTSRKNHNTTQHSTTQHITSLPIDIISYHITQREPAHKSTDTSQCLPCTHAQVPNTTENVRSPGCSLYACNQINDLPTPSLSPNRSRLLTHSHKPSHTITIISATRFSRNTAPFRSVPFRSISFHPIPFQYAPLHYTTPNHTTLTYTSTTNKATTTTCAISPDRSRGHTLELTLSP